MGWTIVLHDEERKAIEGLDVEFESNVCSASEMAPHFLLLRYLDPYGDTTFNHMQMGDLLRDLSSLKQLEPENKTIDKIVRLANRCRQNTHEYITFFGD